MKKIYLIISAAFLGAQVSAQAIVDSLDENNSTATISDVGVFFQNFDQSSPGYEVPAGSGKHVIYSASMWFGGTDINGQLKLAAPVYYPNSQDFWPGGLTNDGAAVTVNPNPFPQTIWSVSKPEILYHISNYNDPNYTMPNDIMTWPAHGDISQNMSFTMAPFVDTDNDGIYDPANGDYPCIKGDRAMYTIVNDKGGVHGSGGDPIGLEVHYMFYQYSNEPGMEEVTFVDAKVINRGTQTLYDFVSSFWVDADVGGYSDDYFGSDSIRNLMYMYNGEIYDNVYLTTPPAVGIVSLNNDLSSSTMFTNGAAFPFNDPSSPLEMFNVMNGNASNGAPYLDDNGQVTSFYYYGDPNDPSQWSEVSDLNPSGDRRMISSIKLDDPGTPFEELLTPSMEYELSFAVVFAQDSTNLLSVSKLFQLTDEVQFFYDNQMEDCFGSNVSLQEVELLDFNVYPNPTSGTVKIDLESDDPNTSVMVHNYAGKLIYSSNYSELNNGSLTLNSSPGLYFVTLKSENGMNTKKIIVE